MATSDLLPFDALWPLVAEAITPTTVETIGIGAAHKRILREDATAGWDLPMADNSAMDGYAVRAADTKGAPDCELRLLSGDAYAGSDAVVEIKPGTAVPIGTGGLIPPGADAVAIKEIVGRMTDRIRVREAVEVGAHIRRAGEELRAGETVVPGGTVLTPVRIAAAAASGVRHVAVGRRPEVAVLSTGSELVALGETARPGQVVNTNAPLLAMEVERLLGESPVIPDHAVDDRRILGDRLGELTDSSDVLILSGGVSVGDRDLVKEILERELGFERLVWRVAQKPGKPTYVARRAKRWVIGLPGNPAAVATGWATLVRPLLLALMGASDPAPPRVPARLEKPVRPNRFRTHLRWGRASWRESELWMEVLGRAGSHMLSDLARSDLLAVIPAGETELPVGAPVEALVIGRD